MIALLICIPSLLFFTLTICSTVIVIHNKDRVARENRERQDYHLKMEQESHVPAYQGISKLQLEVRKMELELANRKKK